jgi:threonine dehydratase
VLGPGDDITRFEYMQKHNKETGPALIGIELRNREDYDRLLSNMRKYQIEYTELNKNDTLFSYLV